MSQIGIASSSTAFNSLTFQEDSGTATPSGGIINVYGTGTISTTASGNTITITEGGLGTYGDGSDGSQTFDGSATVLGLVPSASMYTLARDIFLASSTINIGVSIITNGYRIFCSGTLTNNGTIQWNGNNASGLTAGAALTNSTSSFSAGTGTSAPGTAGGAGQAGAGSNGTNQATATKSVGGAGGAGGAGASGAGGAAGTLASSSTGFSSPRWFPYNVYCRMQTGSGANVGVTCGTGGGGGGGGGGANFGGGGGGGGGAVVIAAAFFAGTGNIQAIGGNGANGTAGNSGGGGGGGGGLIEITSRSVSGGAIAGQTISVAGGTKGLKSGTGADGNNGNTGITILMSM